MLDVGLLATRITNNMDDFTNNIDRAKPYFLDEWFFHLRSEVERQQAAARLSGADSSS
jgi:hypothetical protein